MGVWEFGIGRFGLRSAGRWLDLRFESIGGVAVDAKCASRGWMCIVGLGRADEQFSMSMHASDNADTESKQY